MPESGSPRRARSARPGKPRIARSDDRARGGNRSEDADRSGRRSGPGRGPSGGRGPKRDRPTSAASPPTEAKRRSAAIKAAKARRGPTPRPAGEESAPRADAIWIDEGPVEPLRAAASAATRRAGGRSAQPPRRTVEARRDTGSFESRLAQAAEALERDRLVDARRLTRQLLRSDADRVAVQQLAGAVYYRLGEWHAAVRHFVRAQQLQSDVEMLPMLADCYRALGRHREVDRIWTEVRAASPRHEVMAEARIVTAGSLADRGKLDAAIALLQPGRRPKRIRDHHLRQWYALADLYDRAGDPVAARRWFSEVAQRDPEFVDVFQRLETLGG